MKRFLALFLALLMVGLFAACGGNGDDTTTDPSNTADVTVSDVDANASNADPGLTEEDIDPSVPGSDVTGESVTGEDVTGETVTGEDTTGVITTGTTNANGDTNAPTQPPKPPETLTGKAALDVLNAATKKAVDSKAGYKKTRYTEINKLDFGALGSFQIVKDAVYGFFDVDSNGKGTKDTVVKKGTKSDELRASTWTVNDVKSATAVPDGKGGYTITVLVKDGSTTWTGKGGDDKGSGSLNNPIDKGPLCYGTDDNSKYDHKTARNIYTSINNADDATTEGISEKTTNVKFEAKVDANGNLTRLYGYMDMKVDVHHVKYLIVTLKDKSGSGYGTITYDNFAF